MSVRINGVEPWGGVCVAAILLIAMVCHLAQIAASEVIVLNALVAAAIWMLATVVLYVATRAQRAAEE